MLLFASLLSNTSLERNQQIVLQMIQDVRAVTKNRTKHFAHHKHANKKYWRRNKYNKRTCRYKLLMVLYTCHHCIMHIIKLKHVLKNCATQTTKPSETTRKEKPKENGAEVNESTAAKTTQSNSMDQTMKGGAPPIGDHSQSAPDLGEDNDMVIPFGGGLDSTDWLSYRHISQCLKLLLHSKYSEARHQPSSGSAYEVCSVETLQGHLNNGAKGMPFVQDTDFPKVLHNTLRISSPSPTIVVGDHQQWRLLCIDAHSKTVSYIDPMGTCFPFEIQDMMKCKTGHRHHMEPPCMDTQTSERWTQLWNMGHMTKCAMDAILECSS